MPSLDGPARKAERDRATLGRLVHDTREELTMTPAELADKASIDREQLEALEAGRITPPDDLLRAVGHALDLDAEAFVTT